MVLACEHSAAAGAVFNVSDGAVHTQAEIIALICRAVGKQPPRSRVPLAAARSGVGACERVAHLVGVCPPVSSTQTEAYSEDVAVAATRIQRVLGFSPAVNLDRGWREAMAGLRSAGAW